MNFKEKWEQQDETCPTCGAITKRKRGFTKQNMNRLLSFKWDMNELIITFLIVGIVIIALIYMAETKTCRNWVKEQMPMYEGTREECNLFCSQKCALIHSNDRTNLTDLNLTSFNPVK